MLDNILKTIDNKAEQEIDSINKEKDECILALAMEHKKNLASRHEEKKNELASKIRAEIEEFRQTKQQEASFRFQAERNKVVEAVYSSSKDKVSELNDDDFKKVIKGLLSYIPKGLEGELSCGKRTAGLLRQVSLVGVSVKDDLEEEGFMLCGKDVEIDLRISQMLKQNRETTDPQVINLLFN